MRISDWSSDVCSSDLVGIAVVGILDALGRVVAEVVRLSQHGAEAAHLPHQPLQGLIAGARAVGKKLAVLLRQVDEDGAAFEERDRLAVRPVRIDHRRHFAVGWKSVVSGKSVSVRVDLGGGRINKKKNKRK